MKAYSKTVCYICGLEHSRSGHVVASHMRKHVREGKVVEITYSDGYSRQWVSPDFPMGEDGYFKSSWQKDYETFCKNRPPKGWVMVKVGTQPTLVYFNQKKPLLIKSHVKWKETEHGKWLSGILTNYDPIMVTRF